MLLAAAIKAPSDPAYAAKKIWDTYYGNHQRKGSLKHLKVADIFMGGGTTLVEGSRLGMQMFGVDLNPVAWFVVKQEFAKVDLEEVQRLLADIEDEVKPQIMPYFCCDGPNGEKGKWTHAPSGRIMDEEFNPLSLRPEDRKAYKYEGPEIIYTFWAKHGPCQVTGCGHRTPVIKDPVMAVKTLSVKYWAQSCNECGCEFDVEEKIVRMAPDSPLFVNPTEKPYVVLQPNDSVSCPNCEKYLEIKLGKSKSKKVSLSLLIHPQWISGNTSKDSNGYTFGGSAQDDAQSTALWNEERAKNIKLLEVRGELPGEVTCPETNLRIITGKDGGNVPKKSHYSCAACGTVQDVLTTVKASGKTGPIAAYAIQGYSPNANNNGLAYNGRFFTAFNMKLARQYNAANKEWEERKDTDLALFWPRSELPYGFMTHHLQGGVPNHGFTHWWTMFNPRQMLVLSQLLKAILSIGDYSWDVREYVLGAFQQYLRNENMFCFWDISRDCLAPHMSNNNYHPKSNVVENCVFPSLGRGNWSSCVEGILEGREWGSAPWDSLSTEQLRIEYPKLAEQVSAKSVKVYPGDQMMDATVLLGSATDLSIYSNEYFDLVITDPPFSGLLHYSELSDFFYVWLRLALKDKYPKIFSSEFTPKALEVVANRAREPDDSDGFYQRLLTQSWREAHRLLKPGGILAFTFHHKEDDPWISVLESLFDAGFYLEATYPIRSDETKGEGEFGSKTIEYDIIHVCRKRLDEPTPVSWGRMRREVLGEVRHLQSLLDNHSKDGLPAADAQVIRRGKALEYYSRHYLKVYLDEGRIISVKEALVGINQLIEEDTNRVQDPPPVNAEPTTRQFLRIFDGVTDVARDQMQKFLRGTGNAPEEFVNRGWCEERSKVFHIVEPLAFAQGWHRRHRSNMTIDFDQAWFLIGACFDGSGINATDTLNNDYFKPHPALRALLEWVALRGATLTIKSAARRAITIYNTWTSSPQPKAQQLSWFSDEV